MQIIKERQWNGCRAREDRAENYLIDGCVVHH